MSRFPDLCPSKFFWKVSMSLLYACSHHYKNRRNCQRERLKRMRKSRCPSFEKVKNVIHLQMPLKKETIISALYIQSVESDTEYLLTRNTTHLTYKTTDIHVRTDTNRTSDTGDMAWCPYTASQNFPVCKAPTGRSETAIKFKFHATSLLPPLRRNCQCY